jgi:urease subunit alpha
MARMTRDDYAHMYGPTTGDVVRLGDTSLLAEVEYDHAVPGEECLHGGGKTLRDGLGLTPGYDSAMGALDMLLCNALVIDPVLGVVKGDVGIKDGRIVGVGKAGNPATMDGVDANLVCGAATTVRDAEGLIATPGGIDVHVHFDSAQLCEHAISAGLTTMIGGSLGPITVGIDCGGAFNVGKMLQAAEHWPINFGFLGRGNTSKPRSIYDQIAGGAFGLKIHEDWGAMPAVIDVCLSVADELDFQVQLHTDTLNESGFL